MRIKDLPKELVERIIECIEHQKGKSIPKENRNGILNLDCEVFYKLTRSKSLYKDICLEVKKNL